MAMGMEKADDQRRRSREMYLSLSLGVLVWGVGGQRGGGRGGGYF